MKRIGLFLLDSSYGKVGDYVYFLLNDLLKNLDRLKILTNKCLTRIEDEKLLEIADEIIVRDNLFSDEAVVADLFNRMLKNGQLFNYDEVVVVKDNFYGPFFPFAEVFNEMGKSDVDFWGITKRGGFRLQGQTYK